MRDQTFMTSLQKGGEEFLKFVIFLWIQLILTSRSIVHFCKCGVGQKIVLFCGRHTSMIPNVKKVTFFVFVPVLQRNSHPHFLVCKC